MKVYPESSLTSNIEDLHARYLYYTLYGLEDTPLFNTNNNQIHPEAKSAFTAVVEKNETNKYTLMLKQLLELTQKSNDKLGYEIEYFRNSIIER